MGKFFAGSILLLSLLLPVRPAVADDSGASSGLSSEFSDYVPYPEKDEVLIDDAYMYLDNDYAVELGTGASFASGSIGSLVKPAYPTFDFHLTYFCEFRWACQIGVGYAKFSGALEIDPGFPGRNANTPAALFNNSGSVGLSEPIELRMLTFSIGAKRYWTNHYANKGVASPNPYMSFGLSMYQVSMQGHGALEGFATGGSLPLPVPYLGFGAEIALKPHTASLDIGVRYLPADLLQGFFGGSGCGAVCNAVGASSFGSMYAVDIGAVFIF